MSAIFNADAIVDAVERVVGGDGNFVALHEPRFAGNEWIYLKHCLDTGWVSSLGAFVDRFERQLVDFTGIKYAVAVVNGTAALHLCLLLSGVTSGDEVLVPALSFVATANSVAYCSATPHFVDSEEMTLGIDPGKLADYLEEISEIRNNLCYNKLTGRPIRAVVPMHTFGHPVNIDPLVETCKRFRLKLVEDAAEAIGSFYKKKHVGSWGECSALSFNGNKTITTGGGGAILTNNIRIANLARHLSTTAKVSHKWSFYHDNIGFNYRLPNINAALGCAQLEQFPSFLRSKRSLAREYEEAFSAVSGVTFFREPEFTESNYWLNALLLDREFASERDSLLELANTRRIMARPVWTLLPKLPMYRECPCMELSVAEDIERRLINIPSSPFLYDNSLDKETLCE